MRKLPVFLFSLLLVASFDLEARGGGGMRGGGMERSPSMSRAYSPRAADRPLGTSYNRPASRDDLNRYAGDRSEFANRALRDPNYGNAVRNDFDRGALNRGDWFNRGFWDGRNFTPPYLGAGRNWWGWGTAAGVGSWLGWAGDPVYYGSYDDSDEEPQNTAAAPPAPQTQTQTQQNNQQGQSDWMSLGVFALTQGNSGVTPNLYLQLALKRDGSIAGTLFNQTTNQTSPITGIVDKETQKVMMQVVGNNYSPVLETGIYDLTRPQAAAEIHFNDGTTQEMMLVRLNQPTS